MILRNQMFLLLILGEYRRKGWRRKFSRPIVSAFLHSEVGLLLKSKPESVLGVSVDVAAQQGIRPAEAQSSAEHHHHLSLSGVELSGQRDQSLYTLTIF